MTKKNRKEKKEVEYKTSEDRKTELLSVMKKLNQLGLNPEIDGVKEFYKICKEYINDGVGKSGRIKLDGFKREIEYILPSRKQSLISVNLRHNSDI